MGARYFGAAVRRREDPRLLRVNGRFVDDLTLPGLLHAAFLRSPHAHATVRSIDISPARVVPGVLAVFGFADLARWMLPLPLFGAVPPGLGRVIDFRVRSASQTPMAERTVRYVGEIVAMVVADSRAAAEDALETLAVEYELLPAVTDPFVAVEPGATLLHPEWGDNIQLAFQHQIGDVEAAFRAADAVVSERYEVQRYVGMPIETRGVVASYDRRDDSLLVWSGTQTVHFVQQNLAKVFNLPIHRVRVIAPDVGGGFGTKATGYPEEVLVPIAARLTGRPVKWIEDRREHLMAAAAARDQIHEIAAAASHDGTLLAIRDRITLDLGAFNPWGCVLPYNTVAHLIGPYRCPSLEVEVRAVVTNKMVNAPYRGAGRPEVVFAVEQLMDRLAGALGMDPADFRRRNFIRADEMPYDVGLPYRDGNPLVYDGGDFPATLEAALEAIGYGEFRRQQRGLRERGVYRGIGIAGYVEGTGIGPYEGASVRLDLDGRVIVASGAASQGQGHETVYAQIAADALDVPIEWVTVVGGDSAAVPFGLGTYASRGAVTAGSSIHMAASEVRQRLVEAAAALLEVAPADVELSDGQIGVRGVAGSAISLAALVQACLPSFAAPGPAEPRFEASAYHHVPTVTYANAVHIALVEVDPESGAVQVLRYVVAHDCGRVINPPLVEGQIHGGVAQGLGGGLLEEIVYDAEGQLLTASLMDYLVPTSVEVPPIEQVHLHTPSPRNPLGVKGVGEGGAISPPAALGNAVADALAPFGVRVTRAPLSPDRVLSLLRERRG